MRASNFWGRSLFAIGPFGPFGPFGPLLRAVCVALVVVAQIAVPAARAAALPGMGDGEMPASSERSLGDRIARELYRENSYLDDPVLAEYVQGIWQRLMEAARARGELTPELEERFAWQVLLFRDREINAFALPGGYLGLNLGLVAVVGSPDELATVLGHELSHVTQRHISRMLAQGKKQAPLLIAGMILGALAAAKSKSGGDLGQAVMVGSQAYMAQSQLTFSRDMEREADRVGFGVMTQAGFAPQGASAMFDKLQHASRLNDNGSYPYLRSHPLNTERIADMQARFQMQPGTGAALPLRMEHAMMASRARVLTRPGVDVLRQWVNAADGSEFSRAAPAQQAGMLYAAALAASSLRDFGAARQAARKLESRAAADPAAARLARLLLAEIELAAGDARRAALFLNVQAKERPEMLLNAQVALALRDPGPVVVALRDWVALHPRDATAWRQLSVLYDAQGETLRAIRADAEAGAAILDYAAARDRLKAAQDLIRRAGEGKAGAVRIDHYEASIIDTRAREIEQALREQRRDDESQPL